MLSFLTKKEATPQLHVPDEEEEENRRLLIKANELVFGFKGVFRPKQLEICLSVLSKKDTFVIMPTGGGKSLCYACPAVVSAGVTVVISPLISLIEDQVSGFLQLPCGGIPCAYLTSNSTATQVAAVRTDLQRARSGEQPFLKLLYLTPEGIVKGNDIKTLLRDLDNNELLARFVIDEAHCVSAWGHDFRKDYGQLGLLKREWPDVPIVALTATARQAVMDDVIDILDIKQCTTYTLGYDRPNLLFEVYPKPSSWVDVIASVVQYISTQWPEPGTSGIVYCMTKKDCEECADR